MNLIITTQCNKNCSFCFAENKNSKIEHMSIDNFSKLLKFFKKDNQPFVYKILGGEPTCHPQFIDFIELAIKEKINFSLISNGLYTDKNINNILEKALKNNVLKGILINASELNIGQRLNAFKNNYDFLLNLSKNNFVFDISCAITLSRNKSFKEETQYVEWLINNLDIYRLRISLDFLGTNNEDKYFINNKEYGEKILFLVKLCSKNNIVINADCKIYPCIFESEHMLKREILQFLKNVNFSCFDNIPFDIFPDLSYCHCYPANVFGGKNILTFDNPQQARAEIIERKRIIEYSKFIPEECKQCSFFINKQCNSLCLGCSKLESALLYTSK